MQKLLNICLVTFIILLNNATVLTQEKELKYEKGDVSYDIFYQNFEPNAAFVYIKTEHKDLNITSNIKGIKKELPTFSFGNDRIFAIETEKQKFIIKKNGYKSISVLIPKLYVSQKIEIIIK